MPRLNGFWSFLLLSALSLVALGGRVTEAQTPQRAKDNGAVYVVNITQYKMDDTLQDQTEAVPSEELNLEDVMNTCNQSFVTPMDYLVDFNNTGELPDTNDKTYMCYIHCFYEKTGILENWMLNAEKVRRYMWPATGDSIEVCQEEGKTERNACVHAYAIAKCLMMRAIVDARSKPSK